MDSTATTLLKMIKLAEQAERYVDMVNYAKDYINSADAPINDEFRNLFSVAYKNVVGALRSQWRVISSLEQREIEKNQDTEYKDMISEYRTQIEEELHQKCQEVLQLLQETLLPPADELEAKVFFAKMQGDYYRYRVEVSAEDERETLAEHSREAYQRATEQALDLPATHPIKLGLALNFSVFYYEIDNDTTQACELAKKAFDSAIAELDHLKEDSYKDSTLIMQLLRDNLTLWTSENEQDEEPV